MLQDAFGSVVLLQDRRGRALRAGEPWFSASGLGGGSSPGSCRRAAWEPGVTCAQLHRSASPPGWLECVSVCACPRLSEGRSHRILLMRRKHRKAGPLIQSFMLPLFRLLDLIDKNTQANDQFHGLFPLLSIQGIVSCHLVPPLQRENSNIYDQLL